MHKISRKPAHTVTELTSARQHQGKRKKWPIIMERTVEGMKREIDAAMERPTRGTIETVPTGRGGDMAVITDPVAVAEEYCEFGKSLVKRRSRVLRRRTRQQAALDKPRVHDGQWQWGFCYTRALMSVTAENRAFEEKQPVVFLPKNSEAW